MSDQSYKTGLSLTRLNIDWCFYWDFCMIYGAPKMAGFSHLFLWNPIICIYSFSVPILQFLAIFAKQTSTKSHSAPFLIELLVSTNNFHGLFQSKATKYETEFPLQCEISFSLWSFFFFFFWRVVWERPLGQLIVGPLQPSLNVFALNPFIDIKDCLAECLADQTF